MERNVRHQRHRHQPRLRADEGVSRAQQALKDQGFYYGQVTGEKNADTSAAIRRYQIRNGLEITGELNEETSQALRKAPAATPAPMSATTPAPAVTTPIPARPEPNHSDLRNDTGPNDDFSGQDPGGPLAGTAPERNGGRVYQGQAVPPSRAMFAGTPYETAPPEVQSKVILDAQKVLARRGLFKYPVDGVFSNDLEFSLRAYQARVGLRPTGQLDLETLAALELLPGAHERVYTPRRSRPPFGGEPPVRGEWIRP